jgi:hypothetical protein
VVFAAAVSVKDTGYALTANEVQRDVQAAKNKVAPVSTQACDS